MRMHSGVRAPRAVSGLAAALLLAAAAGRAGAQDDPTGAWAPEASGQSFSAGGSASDGVFLYAVGGLQGGSFSRLNRYDPAADSWSALADLSFPVMDNCAAYYGGRLYSVGGFDFSTSAVSSAVLAFDIATGLWGPSGMTLSAPRMQAAAATLGDRVYVAAGLDASFNFSGALEALDPAGPTVASRTSLPAALNLLTMAATSTRLYAAGGNSMGGPVATMFEYAPDTNAWTNRTDLPQAVYAAKAFSLQERVYVTGGFADMAENKTWEFNPGADTWARRADMTGFRRDHAAAAIGGRGYVYGGAGVDTGEEYTPPAFDPPPPPSNTPPVADAGDDRSVEATSADGASVTLAGAGSDDDGDSLTYSWSGSFGTAAGPAPTIDLPLGTHVLTLTVSDGTDEGSDTVEITVVDTTPPVLANLSASPDTLWSPNHDMRQVTIAATSGDAGDPAPQVEILSVASNQAEGGEADWQITGDTTVNLRAERTNGAARIYTVTVRCTDASGNSAVGAVTVCVPHNQGKDSEGAVSAQKAKK